MISFITLPTLFFVFVVGAIIGSFLNVFLLRFHTGRSLNGSSHCMSCLAKLHWYELLPLISYISLRGRCRKCGSRFSARYAVVECVSGIMAVLAVLGTHAIEYFAVMFILAMLCVVIIFYDIDHYIIPDEFVYGIWILFALYGGMLWQEYGFDLQMFAGMVLAGLLAGIFFFILWWYSAGTWLGFGDVKLIIPLGMFVGMSHIFSFIVLSFWIGAGISLLLLGYQYFKKRGQQHLRFFHSGFTMKSEVPFAPFLVISFVMTFWLKIDILDWFVYVF
jgi:leader peptidase (prepilin peptidase) / N-methyltransferase